MQLDIGSLHDALHAAFETEDVTQDASEVASAMMSCTCSLQATAPLAVAGAIQRAWASVNAWRSEDPRAAARVIVRTADQAAACRSLGMNALTAFAHAGRPDADDFGLLLVVGTRDFEQDEIRAVLSTPAHVRLMLLDVPDEPSRTA